MPLAFVILSIAFPSIDFESNGSSSCKIEEIEDEASSVPSVKKAQSKAK